MSASAPWHPRWPGFSARGTLLLSLPAPAFAESPPVLELDGITLARKQEFHVTLLDRELAARTHAPAPGGAPATRLPTLFGAFDWQWRARGERWLLGETQQGTRAHSVIELIEMPAFHEFRHAVGALLGTPVPAAPAHVTLYLSGTDSGIGLPSNAEFERLRLRPL